MCRTLKIILTSRFGTVEEVIPYLVRRADENSSMVVEKSGREMMLAMRELKRRMGLTV